MKYKITFLDYWHLSSGLSAGAMYDSTVVKDENGLPYIPGKTLKGLISEQAINEKFSEICFGKEGSNIGACHFSNAYIDQETAKYIVDNQLKNELYDELKSTKIDENGIALTGSLREIEVVVPITLFATIDNIPTEFVSNMEESIKKVKRMGLNRNRGLGRCKMEKVAE